jgi:ankyrin repeat protein
MELMMMYTYKKFLISTLILMNCMMFINADSCCNIYPPLADESPQKIKIVNDTNHSLNVNLPVPEQTQADITLKKFKSPQELLHEGVIADSAEKIKEALWGGADINQGKDGKSSLLWAILLGRYNAIETLLEWGVKPDNACMEQAIKMKNIRQLLLLIKQNGVRGDVEALCDVFYTSLIHRSIDSSVAFDFIKELVSSGYNIDEVWGFAIRMAYYYQSKGEEAVRFLIFRGANPNYVNTRCNHQHYTPLSMASFQWPNENIIKILIESGANINQKIRPCGNRSQPCSLLSYTIERSGDNPKIKKVVELLLEHGASL